MRVGAGVVAGMGVGVAPVALAVGPQLACTTVEELGFELGLAL